MKTKYKFLVAVALLFVLIANISLVNAASSVATKDGWKYEYTAGEKWVRIVGRADDKATTLIVPEKMEGTGAITINLDAFNGITGNLKQIQFNNVFDPTGKSDGETWISRVDKPELSKETQNYLAKNVTVYGHAYEDVEDQPDNAMLSPKGFAKRYGMKFVDLDNMTPEDVLNVIPNEIKVDIKESEFMDEDGNWGELETAVTNKISTSLKQRGIKLKDITVNAYMGEFEKIHEFYAFVNKKGVEGASKPIKVVYSNSENYNANDAKTIQNYVNNLQLEDRTSNYDIDNAQSLYNLSIEGRVRQIENETGLKVLISTHKSGSGDEDTYYSNGCLYFVKNDIVYAAKHYYILITGKHGISNNINQIANNVFINNTNSKNSAISATEIGKANSNYTKVVGEATKRGYTNVFKVYELKVERGEITNGINVIFDLGVANNGKQAIVVHLKANGTYETFEQNVENGKVEINVKELSPFAVVLKEDAENVQTNVQASASDEGELDGEPKAGVESYVILAGIIALISLAGIIIKKK